MRRFLSIKPVKYGMTVIEVMISAMILSILLGTLFYFFKMSSTAWQQSARNVDLENNALVALTRMEGEIRETVYDSVTIDTVNPSLSNDCICFLSMVDDTTNLGTYNGSNPEWKKYIIYFLTYDPDNSTDTYDSYTLCQREVLLDDPNYAGYPDQQIDQMTYHLSFPVAGQSTGNMPSFFAAITPDGHTTETRVISRYITWLSFAFDPACDNKVLDIELQARKEAGWQEGNVRKIRLVNSIYFRN